MVERLFGVDYGFRDSWGVSRGAFELFTFGTLVVIVALALAGYGVARRGRRRADAVPPADGGPSAAVHSSPGTP